MKHYKFSKLLNDLTVSNFVTKRWIEINDLSSAQYSVNKNINFDVICDYIDVYIVAKGRITVARR